ncbi:DNA translocase FtsK [Phaeovibrio sulfidiphilus]|uniref:DNA translocase FtsK n=2 Tax=Phaeovibrio sulfidiphilus TaxID=1220600 RepID=A0A8J7CC83_9PROT|nr:DNA translocase FtsK [Phaeovibrio sulfidiphilus]
MNDRPFALHLTEWPADTREWFIEVDRGCPQVAAIWGTGTDDEATAAAIAYAFVAGIEWAERDRDHRRDDVEPEVGDDSAFGGQWLETTDTSTASWSGVRGNAPLAAKILGGVTAGQVEASLMPCGFGSFALPAGDAFGLDPQDDPDDANRDGDIPSPDDADLADAEGGLSADAGAGSGEVGAFPADFAASTENDGADADGQDFPDAEDAGSPDGSEADPIDEERMWAFAPPPVSQRGRAGATDPKAAVAGDVDTPFIPEPPADPGSLEELFEAAGSAATTGEAPATASAAASAPEPESASASASGAATARTPAPLPRPSVALLSSPPEDRLAGDSDENELAGKAAKLETVLKNFRVRGEIMEVRPGPCVTLFELEPVPGTKSSTIINLADDIARSMSAVTCRIALVPGRSVIGIELPNETREMVYLREILDSRAWRESRARLPMALGKDIGGEPVVVDLARMPHLLIAGTTGSGKSVGINAMILSLLYHLEPEQCRLIMIDPKMLELSVYDDIPHLLTPVVTDPHKAVSALKWVVREMENRYRAMALLGVRNLDGYNARVADLNARGEQVTSRVQVGFDKEKREPIFEDRIVQLEPLPCIVVVVDEMADLMLVAGKEIETLIQRLAQMARAAGIHLIMATQRPSVDVITGTIKANFPTRISFQVTSKIDSRTILGESGAEQLLGQGDMLFMRAGGKISRVHGAFVSDHEVESVVAYLQAQGQPDYVYAVTEDEDGEPLDLSGPNGNGGSPLEERFTDDGEDGDLYSQAIAVILREGKVSVSFVQRHLQIGYNRAARLVERMENEGVVSAPNHVGKREILPGARSYFAGREG